MNIFQKIYYGLSRYTDPAERRVGRFFGRVNEKDSATRIEKKLLGLLQNDIAVINLWTEHRYKGYDYLKKRTRRQLYSNLKKIHQDFSQFAGANSVDPDSLIKRLAGNNIDTTQLRVQKDKLAYLMKIMRYLSPSQGRYEYRASSSFGRLLRDPTQEKMVGDCNQIVTLYLALYAAKYDLSDLQLTLYPGHVALHFCGVDIETTSGTFANYNKPDQTRVPVHEIVSVNLLDTTDTNFAKSAVNPEVFLQSARLAYIVSSKRKVVKSNLDIAYNNLVSHLFAIKRYSQALAYAKQSKNYQLIEASARNGMADSLRKKDFGSARKFAAASQDKTKLMGEIDRHEAAHLYKTKQYLAAAKMFERLKDKTWTGHSYRGLYVQEQSKLGQVKTVSDIKANASTIRNMERYAKLSGDRQLQKHVSSLTKYL